MASIVVTADLSMLSIGVMQDRVATPSICTVQAPHSAAPQPNLVPVMPSTSRKTQSSGVSPSASMPCEVPLMLIVKAMYPLLPLLIVACTVLQAILFRTSSTAQLTDVEAEPVFDISGAVETAFQQFLDPVLAGGPLHRGEERI